MSNLKSWVAEKMAKLTSMSSLISSKMNFACNSSLAVFVHHVTLLRFASTLASQLLVFRFLDRFDFLQSSPADSRTTPELLLCEHSSGGTEPSHSVSSLVHGS